MFAGIKIDVVSGRKLMERESSAIHRLYRQLVSEDEVLSKEYLVRSTTPPCAIILGALRWDWLIIGMTFFAPYYKECDEWGYVWNGIIDEQERGRGAGAGLVKRAAELAAQANKRYLLAVSSIPATQAFLHSCGFVEATGPMLEHYQSLKPRDKHGAFLLDLKK